MPLDTFPIIFDDEELFTPESWQEDSGVIESVNSTEAGTDQVIVTRYDKLTVTASFKCSHRWVSKFKAYSMKDSIEVMIYDHIYKDYDVRTMRMRDFKVVLEKNSEKTPGTNGLWTVSFTLIEF